jgi:hypothetical protein
MKTPWVSDWVILSKNKFKLLRELKPNYRPHQRKFCSDMLNCLKQDNLFLDKIVVSDEANFDLSGKVNRHNIIIWGSQNPHQFVEVSRKMDRSWRLHSMVTQITQSDTHGLFIFGIRERYVYIPSMPVDLQEIRDRIVNTTVLVDAYFLDKLWDKLEYRLDVCRVTRDSHIEHL